MKLRAAVNFKVSLLIVVRVPYLKNETELCYFSNKPDFSLQLILTSPRSMCKNHKSVSVEWFSSMTILKKQCYTTSTINSANDFNLFVQYFYEQQMGQVCISRNLTSTSQANKGTLTQGFK